MSHRRIRAAVLACGALALPGIWITIVDDDLDVGGLWVLAGGLLAGVAGCVRVRLIGPHSSGGPDVPRAHRRRASLGDGLAVTAIVLLAGLAAAALAVSRGEDDGTIWLIPFALAFVGGLAWLLGLLAGILVLVPLVTLGGLALRRRRKQAVAAGDALLCLLLPTITAFATLLALSVDSDGPSRSFPARSLPALLAGVDTGRAVVTSHTVLWAARLVGMLLVAVVVLLVRARRREVAHDGG